MHTKNQDFKTVHLVCNSLWGCRQLVFLQTSFTEPAIKEEKKWVLLHNPIFILAVTLLVNNTQSTEQQSLAVEKNDRPQLFLGNTSEKPLPFNLWKNSGTSTVHKCSYCS